MNGDFSVRHKRVYRKHLRLTPLEYIILLQEAPLEIIHRLTLSNNNELSRKALFESFLLFQVKCILIERRYSQGFLS